MRDLRNSNLGFRENESEYKHSSKDNFLDRITLKDIILITISLSLGLFLGVIIGGFRP